MKRFFVPLTILCGLFLLNSVTFAQAGTATAPPAAEKQEPPKKDPEVEKYEKAVKDLKRHDGNFVLLERKKEILLELPEDKLGQIFFIQATLNTGFSSDAQAGDPLGSNSIEAFRFEMGEEAVKLVQQNRAFRWNQDNPLAIASSRSFPEAILGTFKIEARHPERKLLLVNLTNLFSGSLFRIPMLLGAVAGPGYMPDRENTGPEKVKSYPANAVVRMAMHFVSAGQGGGEGGGLLEMLGLAAESHLADRRSLPIKVTYTMWFDADNGYRPRLADPRVGYFTESFFDIAKFNRPERREQFINRFHLVKKNPNAPLSEPVQPIVWYLDHSIPAEYRPAVRKGILFWNKAFEKIGYKDAMVVKDAPNDPDWDHADGRFNIIRWTMSPSSAYAVAWFRTNPMTGEIINAAVTVDANYPASAFTEYFVQVKGAEGKIEPVLRQEAAAPAPTAKSILAQHGWCRHECQHAEGLAEQAAIGWQMIQAAGGRMGLQPYIDMLVADLIAHEVGHCLGLRHNFAASTYRSTAELSMDSKLNAGGVASSVMDYTPLNIQAVLNGGNVFYNPTIGVYDEWAIRYGYADSGANSTVGEGAFLAAIARQSGQPGLLYLTDEDADGINPIAVRWDLGADPLVEIQGRSRAYARLIDFAIKRYTQPGESYAKRNALIVQNLRLVFRDAGIAARMIGGVENRRQFRGDAGEAPTLRPVSAENQRAAMRHIVNNVLAIRALSLPQDVLYGLSPDPDSGMGGTFNAPLRRIMSIGQVSVLSQLLSSNKTDAILENAFKTLNPKDQYTLTEHYNMLFAAVFREVDADLPISDLRRDLQRFMIQSLMSQANAPAGGISDDVRVIASQGLTRLHARMGRQLARPGKLDEMTILHLSDIRQQIDRWMKRQTVVNR